MDWKLCRSSLLCLTVLLAACGGGGTDPGPPSLWQGTYTPIQTEPPVRLVGIVKDDGTAYFYDANGILFSMPKITPAKSVTGDSLAFPPYGFVFEPDTASIQYSVTANISDTELSGQFYFKGGGGAFKLAAFNPFSGTPSVVPGTWSGVFIGGYDIAFQVDQDGVITGFDGLACTLNGSIKLIEAGKNLFAVSIATSGGASFCGHSLHGLAYESDKDDLGIYGHADGTYYYITASDSSESFLTELKVQ